MPISPWKILKSNYLRNNVRIDTCETSDGKILEPLILEYGTWVTIVALTKQQEVLLIKQYRHGAGKILLELPGGAVGEGEEPIVAAKRELLEETGYTSDNIVEVGRVSPNPASHTNLMYAYLALDVEHVGDQSLDETEEIEVFPFPLDQVILMVKNGELLQSLHVSTFFFALYRLNRIVESSDRVTSSDSPIS
ncbi:MAG TPA: NUDIX hydrolase [Anaerolineales bacterium]|nr:NUDIX hydrolase [Anaerolineales bacterium]